MKRLLALVVVLAVLGGGWLFRDHLPWPQTQEQAQPQARAPARGQPPKSVSVMPVTTTTVVDRVEGVGTVMARDAVALTVEAPGIVRTIHFADGDRVKEGAVLLRLDDAQEAAQVASARTALDTARRAHARATELRRGGTAPQQVLDDAAAALEAARAALAVVEARLAERTVRAPFSGRMGFREVSPGSYIRPGEAFSTLDDVSSVRVDFMVPERLLAALALGQGVALHTVAHPGRGFEGRIVGIGSRIDQTTRQVQVRAEVPNPEDMLRPGQLARVEIALRERTAVVVPETAVVTVGHQSFAFVADEEGRVTRRHLALAGRRADGFEIANGLAPGERLVVEGAMKLADGDRIRAVPPVALADRDPGT